MTDEQLKGWEQLTSKYNMALEHPNTLPYLEKQAGNRMWILQRDGDCFFPEAFTPRYLKENYYLTLDPDEQEREKKTGLRLTLIKEKDFIRQCLDALESMHKAVRTSP
ncbi:MAG: hypothetical protein JOZ18_01755, partial [Chloroflexi bacterium]|nr:hypothetical protein [Chloroflexota bacterium]